MTKKQKIGVAVFLAIVVILVLVLILLVMSGQQAVDETTDDDGSSGETVVTETKMDEYGNVTTVDPDLITTYFPYQVMRKHASEELVDFGFEYTLRYALDLDEEARIITAIIEYCDVEADKALVQQYIDSIPLDLSAYTVNYETFSEDAICDE